MSRLDQVLARGTVTPDAAVPLLAEVCGRGDVMIVKSDGLREDDRFTCVIDPAETG